MKQPAPLGKSLTPVRLYVIASALSVLIAVLANVFVPGPLTTIAATFAILAPMATLLVVDRLTAQRDVFDLREEILDGIRDAGRSSGQVVSLGSDDAWVRYIERNAVGARAILNTRLSPPGGIFSEYHQRIDQVIASAVISGTKYSVVCSLEQKASISSFVNRLPVRNSFKSPGSVGSYVMNTVGKPLLQMKIFDYDGGYSEAMVGFLSRAPHDAALPIFLVRNPALVDYMRQVFYSYCEDAETTQGPGW